MNLHRSHGKPDWHDIPTSEQTAFQRTAARTHGIITIGNVISVIGLAFVVIGCHLLIVGQYWFGGGLIVLGRLMDLADGYAADKTQTKGPVGELIDAAFDKIGTLTALVAYFIAQIAPWLLLAALLAPQVAITIISAVKKLQGRQLHPSPIGKLSMAVLWAALASLLIAKAIGLSGFVVVSILLSAGTFTLGTIACAQYIFQKAK